MRRLRGGRGLSSVWVGFMRIVTLRFGLWFKPTKRGWR